MSLSNPRQSLNSPAKKFMSWAGAKDKGFFKYYDKESKLNIDIPLPVRFIYLDQVASISGFNQREESNIYSNYFRRKADEIKVRLSKTNDLIVGGTWGDQDVKDKITAKGGKYTANVFVMDQNRELVCLTLKGAAVTAWFQFTQRNRLEQSPVFQIASAVDQRTKSGIEYKSPVFQSVETSDQEIINQAIELDKVLQQYLNSKMGTQDNNPIADLPDGLDTTPEPMTAAKKDVVDMVEIEDDANGDLPF